MFHPVGSQPPSVYWRRRVVALASVVALIVLLVLTVNVLSSSGGGAPAAQSSKVSDTIPVQTPSSSLTSSPKPSSRTSTSGKATSSTSSSSHGVSSSSSAPPPPCTAKALALAAESDKSDYAVGDPLDLSILVTNTGKTSCVQNLADSQIVLRVYNGESRVWGSHDCKVEPGTDDRALMAGHSVRVSVQWGGKSSQPKCAGQRQQVGAGTYTLYASLSGHQARAAQFSIG